MQSAPEYPSLQVHVAVDPTPLHVPCGPQLSCEHSMQGDDPAPERRTWKLWVAASSKSWAAAAAQTTLERQLAPPNCSSVHVLPAGTIPTHPAVHVPSSVALRSSEALWHEHVLAHQPHPLTPRHVSQAWNEVQGSEHLAVVGIHWLDGQVPNAGPVLVAHPRPRATHVPVDWQ